MLPSEQKAFFLESSRGAFAVRSRPVPTPGPTDLLVRVEASALNPLEWMMRDMGLDWIQYPGVLGCDGSGVVTAVGAQVTKFKLGDKILFAASLESDFAAHQQYCLVRVDLATALPANIDFDQGASVPLGLSTAAVGLYASGNGFGAGLYPFTSEGGIGKYASKVIIIFGGASTVGQFVIQFAKLSGFSSIITTASDSNGEYLRTLGATHVLPRTLDAAGIQEAVRKITPAGIDVVYDTVTLRDTQAAAYELLGPGGSLIFFAVVHESTKALLASGRKQIRMHPVFGSFERADINLGKAIYGRLTSLLEDGSIKPPRVQVLPGGLNAIEEGLALLKNNKVSGQKLVVHPQETT